MVIDLGVRASNQEELSALVSFARSLGFSGIAVSRIVTEPFRRLDDGFLILKRVDVNGKRLSALKKNVGQHRRKAAITAIDLVRDLETANWAAEDGRIDLIVLKHSKNTRLKDTTASLAAESGTALGVPFSPLLQNRGLARSKILKMYRESIGTALDAKMRLVLLSGTDRPLEMRAPISMRHIAELLGVKYEDSKSVISDNPQHIVDRSLVKLGRRFVAEGVEILEGGKHP
jgi:RNase P/RNase MRP subunit p30